MEVLNLVATPNQEILTVLDDQSCTIQVRQIGDYLYFSLAVCNEQLIDNAIIMLNCPIITRELKDFKGNFICIDDPEGLSSHNQPSYDKLGEKYQIIYIPQDEI